LKYRHGIEKSYFDSLSNLAALYKFEPLNVDDKVYPYNIHLSFEHARNFLKIIHPDTHLVIINDESRTAGLATVKNYNTGTCLYYIAIEPLHSLLKEGKNKKRAELLLSVFAYLYQIVNVPYFGIDGNYLFYAYEAIQQWIEEAPEEWEEDEYKEMISQFRFRKYVGQIIERKIRHPIHLKLFEARLKGFVPQSYFDEALLEVAQKFSELYIDYPKRSIDAATQFNLLAADEEDSITVDQYLSFFWSAEGFLYDQLMDYVTTSLQELCAINEPQDIQHFDTLQTAITHCFDFEERFFDLLHELCDLLC
jgi:hypothetical protein